MYNLATSPCIRPGLGPRRILVVDDDELNRRVLTSMLESLGCTPLVATGGEEALLMLDAGVDLVLLDALMPGRDGFSVAGSIRSGEYGETPIIMITTLSGREDRLRAVQAGVNDFIAKPVDKTELKVRMASLLALKDSQDQVRASLRTLERTAGELRQARLELEQRVEEGAAQLLEARDRLRAEAEARERMEWELTLIGHIFEHSREGVTLTDAAGAILRVNRAFTAITGYEEHEVLGHNPRILKSDRHDDAFYAEMWRALAREGQWAGEIWNRRKNGEAYLEWLNIVAVGGGDGQPGHYLAMFHDITEDKQREERIRFSYQHDALTGLPNRALLLDRLRKAASRAARAKGRVALLFLDLDHFKTVNESLGHVAGDGVLQEAAGRLQTLVGDVDTVAKLSGDEFVVVAEGLDEPAALALAQRIQETLAAPFVAAGKEVFLSASVGVTFYPEDARDSADLLKNAELAMYRAKGGGRGQASLYTRQYNTQALRRLDLEARLRRTLAAGALEAHFQPQVNVTSGQITGMEALARWRDQDGSYIPPAEFILLAEETGLILPLGEQILHKACGQAGPAIAAAGRALRLCVNLSPRQFGQPDLVDMVRRRLDMSGMAPENLELEITESSIMADLRESRAKLAELAGMGVSLAVDDFGTGYSCLAHLKNLPLHVLKIDRSFVRDIATDPSSALLVESIIGLGRNFHLKVVAEGVETREQLEYLRERGCSEVQGYLFGRPMPFAQLAPLLAGAGRLDL
jgi:diguanylate cyclase (GGDEF)-like protein/PAS domain S-box-containing protein